MSASATALIADDEPNLAAYLRELLKKAWPDARHRRVARNGVEAAERIAALEPDLAFLDIKMPGLTGLEVAQGIEGRTRGRLRHRLRRVRGRRVRAAGARLRLEAGAGRSARPDGRARCSASWQRHARPRRARTPPRSRRDGDAADPRLAAVLRQLLAAPRAAPLRYVRASQGEITHQVDVADVLFFQADDKYTCVRTASAEHLIRTTITELAAQLDPERFVQVHRSTIVNLDHLAGTRRDELSRLFVRMRGHPGELPVSRAYVHLFKAM